MGLPETDRNAEASRQQGLKQKKKLKKKWEKNVNHLI